MTDDSLFSEPKKADEFRTESPLRAFAEYNEFGGWLIAKGFRPSLHHLVRYLAAMESREGYKLVQILEADTAVPTMIFRTTARAPLDDVTTAFKPAEIQRGNADIYKRFADETHPSVTVAKIVIGLRQVTTDMQKIMRDEDGFTAITPKMNGAFQDRINGYAAELEEAFKFKTERKIGMSAAFKAAYGGSAVEVDGFWTDDQEEPWKLRVVFKNKSAIFYRGDVVDHEEPTTRTDPGAAEAVAKMDEAQEQSDRMDEAMSKSLVFRGMNKEAVERWIEQYKSDMVSVLIGDGVSAYSLQPKGWRFIVMKGSYAIFKRDIPAIPDWTPPEGAIHGFWADGRLFIDFGRQCLGDAARLAAPPGYTFYGFKEGDQRIAFYTEVTSQSPVDVLETMAEDIADDLGVEVDRDSFQVAREHLKQTVGAYDIPDDQKEEAAEFVIGKFKSGKIAAVVLRDFKKSFMNPKGAPVSHTRLDEQLQFILGGGIDIWLIRNYLASFKMTKQPMKSDDPLNPNHYNGRECADIGERLSPNGYQILKYCWRLGKKDDPCQELGKALWYLESEIALLNMKGHPNDRMSNRRGIKGETDQWVYGRLNGQSEFTRKVALFLWDGYNVQSIGKLKAIIADHKTQLDCGHGLAI